MAENKIDLFMNVPAVLLLDNRKIISVTYILIILVQP